MTKYALNVVLRSSSIWNITPTETLNTFVAQNYLRRLFAE